MAITAPDEGDEDGRDTNIGFEQVPCITGMAGACRNRTYRAPFGAQTVLKTGQATRPNPLPRLPLLLHCYRVDLDACSFRKTGSLHGRACRLVRAEMLRVDLIHLREIRHVGKIHSGFHDILQRSARSREHSFQIREDLLGLLRSAAADQLAALRIERHLSRREYQVVVHNRLAVRAYRFGGSIGGNVTHQDRPSIVPSEWRRMLSAAGVLPSPGMVMISPASATTNPAPAEGRMSRTCSVKPVGAPSLVASSEKEYCVFAMQPGVSPKPSLGSSSSARSAGAAKATLAAP